MIAVTRRASPLADFALSLLCFVSILLLASGALAQGSDEDAAAAAESSAEEGSAEASSGEEPPEEKKQSRMEKIERQLRRLRDKVQDHKMAMKHFEERKARGPEEERNEG